MTQIRLPPVALKQMLRLYDAGLDHCDYCGEWKPADGRNPAVRQKRGAEGALEDCTNGFAAQKPRPLTGRYEVPAPDVQSIAAAAAKLDAGELVGDPVVAVGRKKWRLEPEDEAKGPDQPGDKARRRWR